MKIKHFAFALMSFAFFLQACNTELNPISNSWITEDGKIKVQFTEHEGTYTYTWEGEDDNGNLMAQSGTYTLSEDEKTLTLVNEMEIEREYEVLTLTDSELEIKNPDGEVYKFSVNKE